MKKVHKSEDKANPVTLELRRMGVALEHNNDKISLVAEQVGNLNKTVDGIKKTQDAHTEMIGKLAVNIEIIKEDIEFIKSGFRKKVDMEEFTALTRRVALLEKRR